jgi:hypothetical protein
MPRKVFTAGEILTAADVNTNLMDQAVMVFDSSAARGSAIPSPSEGMVTYLKDTNKFEFYDGAAFGAFGGKILQLVTASTTTGTTTSSGSYVNTSLSASITPSATSSRIVALVNFATGARGAGEYFASVFRGGSTGTNINSGDALKNGSPGAFDGFGYIHGSDLPNTTSSVTYTLCVRAGGGATLTLSGVQNIILLEVAG